MLLQVKVVNQTMTVPTSQHMHLLYINRIFKFGVGIGIHGRLYQVLLLLELVSAEFQIMYEMSYILFLQVRSVTKGMIL